MRLKLRTLLLRPSSSSSSEMNKSRLVSIRKQRFELKYREPLNCDISVDQCSGCCTAVEHTPHNMKVVGSNPAQCWDVFDYISFLCLSDVLKWNLVELEH